MNRIQKIIQDEIDYKEVTPYTIILLGISIILKRNNIRKFPFDKDNYENWENIINRSSINEKDLLIKIIKAFLYYFDDDENAKGEIDDLIDYKKDIIEEMIKCPEEQIINEIIMPYDQYNSYIKSELENYIEFMYKILNPKNNSKIATISRGSGRIEEQLSKNNKVDTYADFRKIETEIRAYALKEKVNYINKNIYVEDAEKQYDYIIANFTILAREKELYTENKNNINKSIASNSKKLKLDNVTYNISDSFIYVIKILNMLNENGKAIIPVSGACLSNIIDKKIRKQLIEKNYIEEVIKFENYLGKFFLLILNKNKENSNINFVDLGEIRLKNSFFKPFSITIGVESNFKDEKALKANVDELMKIYSNNSVEVSMQDIENKDYNLNTDTYLKDINISDAVILQNVLEDLFRGYQITSDELRKMQVDDSISVLFSNDYEGYNYKILEIGNVNSDGEIVSELKRINSGNKNLDRYLLKDGDIVITARGENIKIALINDISSNIIANGSINVIRVDKEKMNPRYLKMFLDSEKGKKCIEAITIGRGKTPSINTGDLRKMIIPCPKKSEQDRLAKEYDEKYNEIKKLKNELKKLVDKF